MCVCVHAPDVEANEIQLLAQEMLPPKAECCKQWAPLLQREPEGLAGSCSGGSPLPICLQTTHLSPQEGTTVSSEPLTVLPELCLLPVCP